MGHCYGSGTIRGDGVERKITEKMLKGTRSFNVNRSAINEQARTVELAFSSEEPVERWWGIEILEHSAVAVDLGRLRDGAALLVNHDFNQQIGVVESATIGSDGKGRAVVRFGKSEEAQRIFQDVIDGIRTKVSVGYSIDDWKQEERDGVLYLTATRWTPYEISIVAVPADASVGVGRSIDEEQPLPMKGNKRMEPTNQPPAQPAAAPAAPAADTRAIQATAAADAERRSLERVTAVLELGEKFADKGGRELAAKMVREGKGPDAFNAEMLSRLSTHTPAPTADLGLSDKEVRQYSVLRALRAMASPQDKDAQEAAAYERELSMAAAKKHGRDAQGFIIPVDVMRAPIGSGLETDAQRAAAAAHFNGRRDLNVGTGSAGGYTVATILQASMIDLLRNRLVTEQAGATVMAGLQGDIAMPRQTGAATAYWVGEGGEPTESQQTIDQVTLSPKTIAAYTEYTRKLLIQSSIDVEAFVRADLTAILALGVDLAALYGTGSSNQPTGLKYTTGLNTVDFAANAPTWAEVVQLETEVAADNADIGNLAYVVNAAGRGTLKTTAKASNTAAFIWEDGEVNGYRALASNQVASNDYWFGNWGDLIIGLWSGIDLLADPYTKSASGGVRITAFQDVDVAARRAVSFCRGNNTL